MHYLLFYEFVPDYLERRASLRDKHLRLAWQSQQRGELMLAGALTEPTDGAVLLFECSSRAVPEQFAATDPYVTEGLVTRWRVREWATVVGKDCTAPVRPKA